MWGGGGGESLTHVHAVLEITHCHWSLTGHLIRMTMHSCMCPISIYDQAQMTFDHIQSIKIISNIHVEYLHVHCMVTLYERYVRMYAFG